MAALIHVVTNVPEDKFTDGDKAQGIVSTIASKFGIEEKNIVMMFNAGAKAWFQNSGDPIFVIKVVAPPQLTTADNVKLAIENITKCVKENHPDVKEDRVLIFFGPHEPTMAGIAGVTMAEYAAKQ